MDLEYPESAELAQKVHDLEIYNHVANALGACINQFINSFDGEPFQQRIAQNLADALEPWAIKIIQAQVPHPELIHLDGSLHSPPLPEHALPEDAPPTLEPQDIDPSFGDSRDSSGVETIETSCMLNNPHVPQQAMPNIDAIKPPSANNPPNSSPSNTTNPSTPQSNDQENKPPQHQYPKGTDNQNNADDNNNHNNNNNNKRKRGDENPSDPPPRPTKRAPTHALRPNTTATNKERWRQNNSNNARPAAPTKPQNTGRVAPILSSFAAPTQASSGKRAATAMTTNTGSQRGDDNSNRPLKKVRRGFR